MQVLNGADAFFGLAGIALVLVLLVLLVVLVLAIVVVVQAYKADRTWWLYLIGMLISPVNLVLIIAWFVHLKKNPIDLGPLRL